MAVMDQHQDSPSEPARSVGTLRPLLASYANYFEVGHNAFEFLIDVGQIEPQTGGVQLMSRIAISPVHAKLLAQLLSRSIAQFEKAHREIPEIATSDDELAILSPQEFERRAMDARNKPVLGGRRGKPDSNSR